jgi:SRSO17 transposase
MEIRAASNEATMDLLESNASRLRFEAYIEQLASIIGHADRMVPLHDYCTGLLLPGERKSVEPMAALTAPARTAAKHQSLLHFVAIAPWSDEAVLTKVRQMALPKIEALGAIEASIIDDTGFPKKGKHSVGVARQYCGQLGKQDNCQAVVSLSIANHHASLPIAHRLYLPQSWADDPDRRKTAKVPADIVFKTKPQIALEQLKAAHAAGIPLGTVLADAGYGYDSQFRERDHETGAALCRGHPVECADVEGRYHSAGARSGWRATVAAAAACAADFRQGAGSQPGRRGLAKRHLAREWRGVHLTLCPLACPPGHAGGATGRGVAGD